MHFKYPDDKMYSNKQRKMKSGMLDTSWTHSFAYLSDEGRGYQVLMLDKKIFSLGIPGIQGLCTILYTHAGSKQYTCMPTHIFKVRVSSLSRHDCYVRPCCIIGVALIWWNVLQIPFTVAAEDLPL